MCLLLGHDLLDRHLRVICFMEDLQCCTTTVVHSGVHGKVELGTAEYSRVQQRQRREGQMDEGRKKLINVVELDLGDILLVACEMIPVLATRYMQTRSTKYAARGAKQGSMKRET